MIFILTGSGRTGTAFLAHVLGRSKQYIVRHEHFDDSCYGPVSGREYRQEAHEQLIWERFAYQRDYYGEVNSYLRFAAANISKEIKVGVVIRHPYDIVLSAINKRPARWLGYGFEKQLDHLNDSLASTEQLINEGHSFFRMEEFTTNVEVLRSIIEWAGIEDVEVNDTTVMNKINSSGKATLRNLEDLDEESFGRMEVMLGGFVEKYYPGGLEFLEVEDDG